ncbi:MAG TPA: hypothetical protein VMZ03_01330 [Chitinophagaceae bacterium]|nr:hypothetical protein [Chitinophagaceae bacterium]
MKYVFYVLLIYIVYQFIFKLVIPVYMASRKIKKGFREMHSRMQEQTGKANDRQEDKGPLSSASQKPVGDYIDFEEVK